jgi:cytochrome P450
MRKSMDENLAAGTSQNSTCPYHSVSTAFRPLSSEQCDDPYSMYARARQEDPVFFSPELQMWVVTRYDDVAHILKDAQRFSSTGMFQSMLQYAPEALELLNSYFSVSQIISVDPPEHTRLRDSVNKVFTPRRIALLEPRMRQLAHELIDRFADTGRTELVKNFNAELPLRVVLELFGIPSADTQRIGQRYDDTVLMLFGQLSREQQAANAQSGRELFQYFGDLITERQAHPQDDVISDLCAAASHGEAKLSFAEILQLLFTIIGAAQETTPNLLSTCVYRLLAERHHWQAIVANPGLIPLVLEEALRRDAPTRALFRTATQQVELGGVAIPQGARLYLLLASANHDEARFGTPAVFNPGREDSARHLALGHGIHYCIGASMLRLETKVALEVLSSRLPSLRLGPGQRLGYIPNLVGPKFKELWVEWGEPK